MGSVIGNCGFFCKLGRGIRKVSNVVNSFGLLPPGVNMLVNAGTNLMGADNRDGPDFTEETTHMRQLNQQVTNNRIGRIPTVF
jgi:hypothetical protein